MKSHFRILLVTLMLVPIVALAQKDGQAKKTPVQGGGAQKPSGDCLYEWTMLFRERGAATVTNGTHDVVISMWSSVADASKCYMGRVEVMDGKIKRPILIQKDDGSFEPFSTLGKSLDPAFARTMTEDQMLTVTDGKSIYFPLSELEGGQIFFYTFVNPKSKGLKEAPSAKSLLKN
jgi:hypothetical protein